MDISQMNTQELAEIQATIHMQRALIEKRTKELEEESGLLGSGGSAYISHCCTAGFREHNSYTMNNSKDYNVFPDCKTAQSYAEAFNIMLGLRHCKGSIKAVKFDTQFVIVLTSGELAILNATGTDYKYQLISPCYATEQDAINAIDTVGKDAIIKTFNTFSGN